jgi:predicted ATPase
MFFNVLEVRQLPPAGARLKAYLLTDLWDDWFKYSTQYTLIVFDAAGAELNAGSVKIGQFNFKEDQRRPELPREFDELDSQFFTLGQDESYYERLNELGPELRDQVLRHLRDLALDQELFERALGEEVTNDSLLRHITVSQVRGQLFRLSRGGARLSKYQFLYKAPTFRRRASSATVLEFTVEPESTPPTNIHVLIGRNGVGKTHLLHHMARSLVERPSNEHEVGVFNIVDDENSRVEAFANVVAVSFSAFDTLEPLSADPATSGGLRYSYIGLKQRSATKSGNPRSPKSPQRLAQEFSRSVVGCRVGPRRARWRHALEMLEVDPLFKDAGVVNLASAEFEDKTLEKEARKIFRDLSSGHKIVLLTITSLIEMVEERTLVLLDEPEGHLHPPLLSAFVRCLSDLMVNRNGVAIIATHSPVVLQEVPSQCAWKIRRTGRQVDAERPEVETFGENVGVLTREVFGLEVTHAGFHKLLRDMVRDRSDFDEIVAKFGHRLGGEAKALLRALVINRDNEA